MGTPEMSTIRCSYRSSKSPRLAGLLVGVMMVGWASSERTDSPPSGEDTTSEW